MAILMVGPGQQFSTIHDAVNASASGDTIEIQSGVYNNDFLTIRHNLTLWALNGQVFMTADQNAPNGKAIITPMNANKNDSPRNCFMRSYFPAPITFLTPTSLALFDARAVDKFMKLMHAMMSMNKATAEKIYTYCTSPFASISYFELE